MNASQPIILVDSEQTEIVAFEDKTPCAKTFSENFTYDYGSDVVLGDNSCRGLGFFDKSETVSGVNGSSTNVIKEDEGSFLKFSPSEKDAGADKSSICKLGVEMDGEVLKTPIRTGLSTKIVEEEGSCIRSSSLEKDVDIDQLGAEISEGAHSQVFSSEKNSGFLSIGGMKLYTQDISSEESDEESLDEESSESCESEDSNTSSDASDSGSDIDEEVVKDYLEGIGGTNEAVNMKWFVEHALDVSDDDGSSSNDFDDTIKKLGGIALQGASKDYGMKKPRPKKKANRNTGVAASDWSFLDDLMYLKDPRSISGKKKHIAKLPQSWPSEAQRSKSFRDFPGKKVCPHMIIL